MRKRHLFSLLALTLLLCFALAGCGKTPAEKPQRDGIRVMVGASQGVTVIGETITEVAEGEDAVFTVEFAPGYVFKSTDAGTFDTKTNTLTVKKVTRPTLVSLAAEAVDYDTSVVVNYIFDTSNKADRSTVEDGAKITLGTEITVTAGDVGKLFSGWTVGFEKEYISTDRTFTFRVTPEMITNNSYVTIRPHYSDLSKLYFDANGGTVVKNTVNAKGNGLATTKIDGDRIQVTLSTKYLEYATCGTAFWHDGTFVRDGYVLTEYNTKPDGSGTAYSPGAKVYQVNPDGGDFVLYCMWEKATAESAFKYESCTMTLPKGIKASNAPDWNEKGVIITGYTGSDKTVAIPETLGGKPVIAIKAGAFKNKEFTTLYFPRTLQEVQDGAVTGCSRLKTLYYPSGLMTITDKAFDSATYSNWTDFLVYASIAPRYSNSESGAYGAKISRLLSTYEQNRIIAIAGSSTLQGLGSAYLEDLLDHEYAVINFGTTRTTHGSLYLEAMQHYAHEGDIVMFAPENSIFMMGDTHLYWKTIRDMEALYDFFRYVDISHYSGMFSSFSEQHRMYTYTRAPQVYEAIMGVGGIDKYGDDVKRNKNGYVNSSSTAYINAYNLSFNNRYKSVDEGAWEKGGAHNDYSDNRYWVSFDESPYKDQINRAVQAVKTSGAKVYFGFAPADASTLFPEAQNKEWLLAYDQLILDTFTFDGIVGSCVNYIYAHEYFFDCAFHTNNYGRTWRTYYLYRDLCDILDKEIVYQNGDTGTDYQSCLFEKDANGKMLTSPKYAVDFLK